MQTKIYFWVGALVFLLFLSGPILAQNVQVTGTITDENEIGRAHV